jgi:uncharacterized protein (TIGR02145 family)
MAENLKTTTYNDGTPIPNITDNTAWADDTTGAYCWYDNTPSYGNPYGALYNWYTVSTGNLCPTGWHVPTNDDWTVFVDYFGGMNDTGGKLKEAGTTHWVIPNTGATNETGYTALPAGSRSYSGPYNHLGNYVFWWSSTPESSTSGSYRFVSAVDADLHIVTNHKSYGFSVRCVKD